MADFLGVSDNKLLVAPPGAADEQWPPPDVILEVETVSALKKLRWHQQGCAELYERRALATRYANRDEDVVQSVLDAFWEGAIIEDGEPDPNLFVDYGDTPAAEIAAAEKAAAERTLSRETYHVLYERISAALIEKGEPSTKDGVRLLAEQAWEQDMSAAEATARGSGPSWRSLPGENAGDSALERDAWEDSLFELADVRAMARQQLPSHPHSNAPACIPIPRSSLAFALTTHSHAAHLSRHASLSQSTHTPLTSHASSDLGRRHLREGVRSLPLVCLQKGMHRPGTAQAPPRQTAQVPPIRMPHFTERAASLHFACATSLVHDRAACGLHRYSLRKRRRRATGARSQDVRQPPTNPQHLLNIPTP